MVLSGAAASTGYEITRDQLIPYASADDAELVYPVAIDESWNAIGCCDGAAKENVNDVGFIEALVAKIDPGHARPIYVVGYSNGGRLAYRMACTDPTLFDGMVAVKADPMPGCVVTKPENVLVLSSMDDKYVPFKPGEKGKETPAGHGPDRRAADRPEVLGQADGGRRNGPMTSAPGPAPTGRRSSGRSTRPAAHNFPRPGGTSPGADQLIWSFMSKTPLAPVPG